MQQNLLYQSTKNRRPLELKHLKEEALPEKTLAFRRDNEENLMLSKKRFQAIGPHSSFRFNLDKIDKKIPFSLTEKSVAWTSRSRGKIMVYWIRKERGEAEFHGTDFSFGGIAALFASHHFIVCATGEELFLTYADSWGSWEKCEDGDSININSNQSCALIYSREKNHRAINIIEKSGKITKHNLSNMPEEIKDSPFSKERGIIYYVKGKSVYALNLETSRKDVIYQGDKEIHTLASYQDKIAFLREDNSLVVITLPSLRNYYLPLRSAVDGLQLREDSLFLRFTDRLDHYGFKTRS